MLVLIVLLAQAMPRSDDAPPVTPLGDIAGLHKTWEDLTLACRKLAYDSPEGEATCRRRDVLTWQLGQLGWCVRQTGPQLKLEMCRPTRR